MTLRSLLDDLIFDFKTFSAVTLVSLGFTGATARSEGHISSRLAFNTTSFRRYGLRRGEPEWHVPISERAVDNRRICDSHDSDAARYIAWCRLTRLDGQKGIFTSIEGGNHTPAGTEKD